MGAITIVDQLNIIIALLVAIVVTLVGTNLFGSYANPKKKNTLYHNDMKCWEDHETNRNHYTENCSCTCHLVKRT